MRLVTDPEGLNGAKEANANSRPDGAGHRRSGSRQRARDDAAIAGLPTPGMEWSPV